MNDEIETSYFLGQLTQLKKECLRIIDQANNSAKTVELDQNRVGRLSRIDAMQGQAMAQANLDRQKSLLVKINSAVGRIEQGEYGRCIDCDELIARKRLEIDPAVTHCIECASKMDL